MEKEVKHAFFNPYPTKVNNILVVCRVQLYYGYHLGYRLSEVRSSDSLSSPVGMSGKPSVLNSVPYTYQQAHAQQDHRLPQFMFFHS